MGKYEPLEKFLREQHVAEVPVTFARIEEIIGSPLPASARRHRPWWANDASGHIHAKAWLDVGYETANVDMQAQRLVFRRAMTGSAQGARGMTETRQDFTPTAGAGAAHPMIGALKGLLWIEPGFDLTQPALSPEEWESVSKQKYGPERTR